MKRTILTGILVLATGASALLAQQGQQGGRGQQGQQPPAPAAQPQLVPGTKTPAESQAVIALFSQTQAAPDVIIKAAEDLLTNFTDTVFKEQAYYLEAIAYQQKKDLERSQIFAEKTLEVNPKNFQASLMIGEILAQSTKENDLDREEKLTKADKLLNSVINDLKTATKPNPQVTDAQWEDGKKFMTAQAHNDLGLIALTRKKNDVAVTEFKTADEMDPQPAYQVRLATAYQLNGKNAEALAICEKLIADPQTHPTIKNVAQSIKAAATKK